MHMCVYVYTRVSVFEQLTEDRIEIGNIRFKYDKASLLSCVYIWYILFPASDLFSSSSLHIPD